jgi:hypothetical protein
LTVLKQYNTPAFVVDFPHDPTRQATMSALWSANVVRWASAAQIGDIYDRANNGPRPAFYNPLVTDTPANATVGPITWNAFPGRFAALFPNDTTQWAHWSDYGDMPEPAVDLCSGDTIAPVVYTPTGPRGWQDEYCEWSVTRDANDKITSVMFTCENPEYWLTLWSVDPNTVLARYRSLVSPKVRLIDLALKDACGRPVIDPTTGKWVYNPLNPWNNGTHSLPDHGGAVHLTSSPNTLGAEFDLAASATVPRVDGSGNPITSAAGLVCCVLYGRVGRNSDPTIGQNVNAFVNRSGFQGALLTLTDPPGLYMQTPDFSTFKTPDGSDPASYWTVVRGQTKTGSDPIDRILHATYSVPASKGFTVSDITIAGVPITYGGQIVSAITMALLGTVFASGGPNQVGLTCMVPRTDAETIPCAQALQPLPVFTAYRDMEQAQNDLLMAVPVLALPIAQGGTLTEIALPLNLASEPKSATVTTTNPHVTVTVNRITTIAGFPTLIVTLVAAASAAVGDCGVFVAVPGQPTSPEPALGLLTVTPAAVFTLAASTRRPGASHTRGRA